MATGDDDEVGNDYSWLDDEADPEAIKARMDADAQKARSGSGEEWEKQLDSLLPDGATEASEGGFDALMEFAEKDAEETKEREEFNAQVEAIITRDESDPADREPKNAAERAAVKASGLSASEMEFFSNQLKDRVQRLQDEASPDWDPEAEKVVPKEEPFNPNTLDSAAFHSFMRAAQRGGASPTDVPPGFTYDDWVRKVDSALAGGIER